MTDKEAMAMALDALEYWDVQGKLHQPTEEAITALKARLAQPHETTLKEFNQLIHDDPKYHIWAKEKEALAEHAMRETQRLGQEIEQEPVAWMDVDGNVSDNNDHKCFPIPLYTQPPQRTWVGLKEEDVFAVLEKLQSMYHRPPSAIFAQAIEAKLKEKNA